MPYGGDYREANAWMPEEFAEYEKRIRKREGSETQERDILRAYLDRLER